MAAKKKQKIDGYHMHEVVDRASLALKFFDRYLVNHPAVQVNKKLAIKAEKIADRMLGFYESAANEFKDR